MTEINYSSLLREIATDYFAHQITRVEYLAQRRSVLDRIDHEFNGEEDSTVWPLPDSTQPTTADEFDITNVPGIDPRPVDSEDTTVPGLIVSEPGESKDNDEFEPASDTIHPDGNPLGDFHNQ